MNSAPGISCIAYLVTILGELGDVMMRIRGN